MKKLLSLALAVLLISGLCGCSLLSLYLPSFDGGEEDELIFIPDDTSYGYYYDQLSDDAKTIYRSIYKASTDEDGVEIILREPLIFTEEVGGEEKTNAEIKETMMRITQPAIDALQYDHPSIFWIRMGEGGSTFSVTSRTRENKDGTKTVHIQKLTFRLQMRHIPEGSTPDAEKAALDAAVAAFETAGETRYEILASIRDQLAARVLYDADAVRPHIAAGALIDGRAVCDGYAKAVKLLCDMRGIPCIVVAGDTIQNGSTESHAWNYIQMEDGQWYAMDTTWDDRGDHAVTSYFLVGADSVVNGTKFSDSHLPTGCFSDGSYAPFTLPPLSSYRYQTLTS